jgi:hypothetical protein
VCVYAYAVPSGVSSLQFVNVTDTSILVTWKPPVHSPTEFFNGTRLVVTQSIRRKILQSLNCRQALSVCSLVASYLALNM